MLISLVCLLAGVGACAPEPVESAPSADAPQVAAGERFFLETRFAQFFFANANGRINAPLAAGDPVMSALETTGDPLTGAFAGTSMNCRACHLVDDVGGSERVRAYNDFARRSPIPDRNDGHTHTPRNAPSLVNASLARDVPFALHYDAEFANAVDLVKGGFTGRNFGWLATEHADAVAHIANVVRNDDGAGALAQKFGAVSYPLLLGGTDPSIPEEMRIPSEFRVDVAKAADEEILNGVARLVSAYLGALTFQRDEGGVYTGSPYDLFLRQNGLPLAPDPGETAIAYTRRLRAEVTKLANPIWVVDSVDHHFRYHAQPFVFGPDELTGLRIFLAEPEGSVIDEATTGRIGNCISCHSAPHFSDFRFHNTGTTQEEYDAVHGAGAFAVLEIPSLTQRMGTPEAYLPSSTKYPKGTGQFLAAPSAEAPGQTDLGLWNVFANDAVAPSSGLRAVVRDLAPDGMTNDEQLLTFTLAAFKTSALRDLGQSLPYFHNGQADTIDAVLHHYQTVSVMSRRGEIRNADPQLARIALASPDLPLLAAFLRALNEDYD